MSGRECGDATSPPFMTDTSCTRDTMPLIDLRGVTKTYLNGDLAVQVL